MYENCGNKKREGSGCGWIFYETKSQSTLNAEPTQLEYTLRRGGPKGECNSKYENCFMKGDDIFVRISCESSDPGMTAQWVSKTSKNTDKPVWNERVVLNATGDVCWMHVHECDRSSTTGKWCNGDLVPNKDTEHLGTYEIPVKTKSNEIHIKKTVVTERKRDRDAVGYGLILEC